MTEYTYLLSYKDSTPDLSTTSGRVIIGPAVVKQVTHDDGGIDVFVTYCKTSREVELIRQANEATYAHKI